MEGDNACKGIREFNVPFWSMLYLALMFKLNAHFGFKNRILISIANKSLTRMECGICFPIYATYRNLSNILGLFDPCGIN